MSKRAKKTDQTTKGKGSKTKAGTKAGKAKSGMKTRNTSRSRVKASNKSQTKIRAKSKTKSKSTTKAKSKGKTKVLAIPKGYEVVTPYLIIRNAAKAIQFYKDVFGAKELLRMEDNQGKIVHAEISIGNCKIMLGDDRPEMNAKSPEAFGGSPVGIHLYMKDVDAVLKKAVTAGAKLERPAADMFYGDRIGSIVDPFGHKWSVATHIEDVSVKETKRRMVEFAKSQSNVEEPLEYSSEESSFQSNQQNQQYQPQRKQG